MRKSFPGYYVPSDRAFSLLWNKCLFVVDANVLLDLYRYSFETGNELIRVLKHFSDRLWVPHQAALEYQQQRLNVISQQLEAYDEMQEFLKRLKNQLKEKLNAIRRHPYINGDKLLALIQKGFAEVERNLDKLKRKHPNLLERDRLGDSLSTLLNGKIGTPYSVERLNEIYKIGKQRYENEVPPGYKDSSKDGARKFGDIVLWFQVIDKAKETKKSIILITNDRKDDWWLRFKGQTISPRPELVDEILSEAGVSFYMYQTDPFMDYAQKYLTKKVKQKAVDEVRDIRQGDEEYLRTFQEMENQSLQLHKDPLKGLRESISSIKLEDSLLGLRDGISSIRLEDPLKGMREGISSIKLEDPLLGLRDGIASLRLEDTLRGLRDGITSLRLEDPLKGLRDGIASLRLEDTLRGLRDGITSLRLQDDSLKVPLGNNEEEKKKKS